MGSPLPLLFGKPKGYLERALSVRPDKSIIWPFDEITAPDNKARAITRFTGDFRATYSGVTLAQPGGPNGRLVPSFDGINDYVNLYTPALANAFNGAEGTIIIPVRVANAGVWTDSAFRTIIRLQVDLTENYIIIDKSNTDNVLRFRYEANNISEQLDYTTTAPIDWLYVGVTWSKSAEQVKYYVNDNLLETDTTLGVWTGLLASTLTLVGADDTVTPGLVWSGLIGPVALYNVALTDGEHKYIVKG